MTVLAASSALLIPVSASAKDCTKTCVEVRREGGELVITAKRDPVRPKIKPPISAPTYAASPTPSPTPSPKHEAKKSKPVRRKKVTRVRKGVPQLSLSDQIRQVLPKGSFLLLPRRGALIREPLIVRASGCQVIHKRLPILDTEIELRLHPIVEWNWGDGYVESWSESQTRGAHIYQRPGLHLISMSCSWTGQYRTPDSSWSQIPEGIVSYAHQQVELYRAQVFFTE